MKHPKLAWNFNIRQWFCTTCGRTSDHVSEPDARGELDQYDCQLPYVEAPEPLPGEETARLDELMGVYRQGLVLKARAIKEAVTRGLRPPLADDAA